MAVTTNICLKWRLQKNILLEWRLQKIFVSSGREQKDIFLATKKIINGHNPNEAMIVDKGTKNEGFFEKFFNFFS